MTSDRLPILVLAATGRQGGSVAKALLKAGWPVRALVRDTTRSASIALRDAGAELVRGSFAEADVIRGAMTDAHGVFIVLPATLSAEEEVGLGITIADLAATRGVGHVVYSSGASVGDKPTGVARFDAKPRIEAHVRTLPVPWTIIRPAIFMEMLVRPGSGLDQGRLASLIRPDQAMQLIAVEDIGKVVAAILADRRRFGGQTLKIAGDTVTGCEMAAALTQVAGYPITYARLPDDVLAASPDLAHMAASLEDGPLADHVDLDVMREINPQMLSFRSWLASGGHREACGFAPGDQVAPHRLEGGIEMAGEPRAVE